jgi:predicted O-methyltransferase YrrM
MTADSILFRPFGYAMLVSGMGKFDTAIKIIRTLARDPRTLNRVLDRDEHGDTMGDWFLQEPGLPQVDILDLLPALSETIDPYSYLEGQALPTDIALLKGLARRFEECRYLEIGTWRGESLANVAAVCNDCVSLTLSRDELRKMGCSETVIACEGYFTRELSSVQVIHHDSHSFDFSKLGRFDLIFIDGDHSRDGVCQDTRNAFKLLKSERSIIIWHDYGLTPERVNRTVLNGIQDGCPPELMRNVYHVSNTLCAIFTTESLNAEFKPYPQVPDKIFAVRIAAERSGSRIGSRTATGSSRVSS